MSKYICKICGKEFDRVGNGVYCPGPHYRPCPVCGEPVEYHRPSDPYNCCSIECTNELASRSKQKGTKICAECGKEFVPKQAVQLFCPGPHITKCVICGKAFEYTCRPKDKPKTCSRNCQEKLRSATAQERYGVDNVSRIDSIKQKISERNGSEEVKAKRAETSLKNWGVDNPAKSPEVAKKMSEVMRSDDYLARREATCLKRYGFRSPLQSPEIKAKLNRTLQRKYGVDWATQTDAFKQHKIQTNLERYGVPHYCMTQACRAKQGLTMSATNKHIAAKLNELGLDTELEFVLESRSYDIRILNSNLLIEIDPTYTHNIIGNHWGPGVDKNYHLEKSKLAAKHGYRCIHIFDWDDVNKLVVMLRSKQPIYARKCVVREVDVKTANLFLTTHHLQGKVNGQKICLGLYHQGSLVQVMTFGSPRYNKKFEYELLRLCSGSRYAVVGGAEKLWKCFISTYSPQSVISYCDRAKFIGDVYSRLGMNLDHTTEPNKIWSKGVRNITNNLLLQRGYDQLFDTNYGKWTSNEELMLDNGWLPVYDCGQSVYTWTA